MSARNAGCVLFVVYLIAFYALMTLVHRVYGIGWKLALVPVEIAGGYAGGTLIGRAGAR